MHHCWWAGLGWPPHGLTGLIHNVSTSRFLTFFLSLSLYASYPFLFGFSSFSFRSNIVSQVDAVLWCSNGMQIDREGRAQAHWIGDRESWREWGNERNTVSSVILAAVHVWEGPSVCLPLSVCRGSGLILWARVNKKASKMGANSWYGPKVFISMIWYVESEAT